MTFWRDHELVHTLFACLICLLLGVEIGWLTYPHLVKRNPVYEDAQLANLTIVREALSAKQIEDMYNDWPDNNASAVDSNWKEIPEEDVPEEIRNLHHTQYHTLENVPVWWDYPDWAELIGCYRAAIDSGVPVPRDHSLFLDIPDHVSVPAGALTITVQQWDALGRIDTIRVRAADLEGLNIYYIGPLGVSWHHWPDVK